MRGNPDARSAERGFVLVTVLMGATLLVALGSSGLMLSRTDLQITGNFVTGTQTLYIAEAGIDHAWSLCDDGAAFASAFAEGDSELVAPVAFGSGTYAVAASALVGSSPPTLRVVSTANGPANARRVIEALLQRVNGKTNMVAWKESF